MPEYLVVRLPATDADTVEVAALDAIHATPALERIAPEEVPERAHGRRCLAVVPGEAVLVTRVRMPTRRRSQVIRALPYALEEQLTSDLDELHFAIHRIERDGGVVAAAVAHEDVRRWLGELETLGVSAEALIPDNGILPTTEGHWEIVADGHRAVMALGTEALSLEAEAAPVALEAALASAAHPPESVSITAPEALTHRLSAAAAAERELELEIEHSDGDLFPRLLATLEPRQALNLLQGPYAPDERWGWAWRPLRPAAALLGVWIVAQATLEVIDAQRLQSERERLQEEIEQVYRETFPEGRVVNPRVQMENHLRNIRGGAEGDDPGDAAGRLLGGAAPALAADGLELRSLRLRDGELEIDLLAGDIEALERLRARIADEPGLEAEIRSASAQDQRVEGRLVVREAAA